MIFHDPYLTYERQCLAAEIVTALEKHKDMPPTAKIYEVIRVLDRHQRLVQINYKISPEAAIHNLKTERKQDDVDKEVRWYMSQRLAESVNQMLSFSSNINPVTGNTEYRGSILFLPDEQSRERKIT